MQSNRPEKGGTVRPLNNESKFGHSPSIPKNLIEIFGMKGGANEREDLEEADRRNQCWSPKRTARIVDERDRQGPQDKQVE
jgi:hypothetical protein